MNPNNESPTKQEKTPTQASKHPYKLFSGYALILLGILFLPIPILPGTILLIAGHQILKEKQK